MRRRTSFIFAALLCILTACSGEKVTNIEYAQKNLERPTRIEKERAGTSLVYEPEEGEYKDIFEAISSNWWKTTEDELQFATDSELQSVDSVRSIKTSTNNRYVNSNHLILRFVYDKPIKWDIADGEPLQIKLLAFVLPQEVEEAKNVKGYFIISETETIGENKGIYTYYYNEEIINSMFGYR